MRLMSNMIMFKKQGLILNSVLIYIHFNLVLNVPVNIKSNEEKARSHHNRFLRPTLIKMITPYKMQIHYK